MNEREDRGLFFVLSFEREAEVAAQTCSIRPIRNHEREQFTPDLQIAL